jgi:hypothetical protein
MPTNFDFFLLQKLSGGHPCPFAPGCDIGMPDYHGGDVEEMEDEYDMNEPVDDMEEEEEEEEDEYQEPAVRDSDVEEEEDEDQSVCTS